MLAPSTIPLRLLRLGRRARIGVAVAAVGGLIALLASVRAARTQPAPVAPAAPAAAVVESEIEIEDPAWSLAADPVEVVGFQKGRRQVFEVVPLGPTEVEVEVRTARAVLAMRSAALAAGIELKLESGFRTVEEQRALFRAWRKGRGNKAARPGMSNHQSGRALDIAVVSVPGALAWLEANGASFGFKRTVKTEPWHWEYVDVPVARDAFKRVSRKAAKHGKGIGRAKRHTQRASSVATASHTSRSRRAH